MKNILLELIKMVKYTVIHSFEKEELFWCESVSYTHLTLPTIRLV